MAYNTVVIKKDADNKPVPQYYNPVTDEYEVLQGTGGAARQVLYGPDGQPISTTEGKLAVRAEEIETLLTALKGKDFATETKLEAVRVLLNSLAGEDFATSAKQAEMLAALGKQSTAEKQDALAGLIGAIDAAAVSDPAAAGAVIALLKGLLSRLQTLENKIDSFTTGEETVNTELKGSIAKNNNPTKPWYAEDAEPANTVLPNGVYKEIFLDNAMYYGKIGIWVVCDQTFELRVWGIPLMGLASGSETFQVWSAQAPTSPSWKLYVVPDTVLPSARLRIRLTNQSGGADANVKMVVVAGVQ